MLSRTTEAKAPHYAVKIFSHFPASGFSIYVMTISEKINACAARVESAFARYVPAETSRPDLLHRAMNYSLCAGGKRLRPVLLLAAFDVFPSANDPLPAAVAVECLQTYSLIHDDLPCMDNSDLRRGKPTCHKVFDEPIALLAGDALLTHALTLLADAYADKPEIAVKLVRTLGDAAGSRKLIGGQVEDMLGERGEASAERLDFIHENKTAALITAAVEMGFILGSAPEKTQTLAREIGHDIGIAFQIIDDILDETSDAKTMGKPVHADLENRKLTYPRFHGMQKSRERANALSERAIETCRKIGGDTDFLVALIAQMQKRIF